MTPTESNPAERDPRDDRDPLAEELLAIRCQLGDRDALDVLIDRYAARLRGYVRRVAATEAEADDLVQETWLRVLRGLPGLRDPRRLRSWLFGITHRVLVDRLRSRYAAPAESSDEHLADDADLQQWHVQRDQVETGLASLAPVDREAVVLFHLEGLSLSEISASTSVPIGTVKSRLHRARLQMRQALSPSSNSDATGNSNSEGEKA